MQTVFDNIIPSTSSNDDDSMNPHPQLLNLLIHCHPLTLTNYLSTAALYTNAAQFTAAETIYNNLRTHLEKKLEGNPLGEAERRSSVRWLQIIEYNCSLVQAIQHEYHNYSLFPQPIKTDVSIQDIGNSSPTISQNDRFLDDGIMSLRGASNKRKKINADQQIIQQQIDETINVHNTKAASEVIVITPDSNPRGNSPQLNTTLQLSAHLETSANSLEDNKYRNTRWKRAKKRLMRFSETIDSNGDVVMVEYDKQLIQDLPSHSPHDSSISTDNKKDKTIASV
jgi:hypothetical protein